MTHAWSAIVVSQGTRPTELAEAVRSLLTQEDVDLEVIVVGAKWQPSGLPAGVRTVHLRENVGAPAARNKGIALASGEYAYFLDDDASLPERHTLAEIEAQFAADPSLGVVQTRIETPEGGTVRRWVPRMRNKDAFASSEVFSVLEGSVAVRRSVLRETDNWPGRFFYAHEGIELAWRAWDAGYRVEYRGDLRAIHPRVERSRHAHYIWQDARNRVWLAKRNLPWPVAVLYIGDWAAITIVRGLSAPRDIGLWLRGAYAGVRGKSGSRRPIRWRTVWLMTRKGRPPIV